MNKEKITKEEMIEVIKTKLDCFDIFEVKNGRVMVIAGGYYNGETVTKNQKEVCRDITYSGAEYDLSDLPENIKKANDFVSEIFGKSTQYVGDITEDEFINKALSYIDEGYEYGKLTNRSLSDGKYIDLWYTQAA